MKINPVSLIKFILAYRRIRKSGLFDSRYYLFKYPDVRHSDIDPVTHYLLYGAFEQRNPSERFNTQHYTQTYHDIDPKKINPLFHYLKYGQYEGRTCGPDSEGEVEYSLHFADSTTVLMGRLEKDKSVRRAAVMACYSSDGTTPDQLIPYLEGLREVSGYTIVVFDNEMSEQELAKIKPYTECVLTGRHNQYDFGSYKIGYKYLDAHKLLDEIDEIIFCNDSCFAPVGSFEPMFNSFCEETVDFWGVTDSFQFGYHLQSYFLVFRQRLFKSEVFREFMDRIERQPSVSQVVLNYEIGMTSAFLSEGFSCKSYITNSSMKQTRDPTYQNLTFHNLSLLKSGCPLLKTKALRHARCSVDGANNILCWLKENNVSMYNRLTQNFDILKFEEASRVAFSVIMATKDRRHTISNAIQSVLDQTHNNYELIIIDDGSTDGTEAFVKGEYGEELEKERIRYLKLDKNVGVSSARNIGLSLARNPWIAYIDSDNRVRSYFLTVYANAIVEHPSAKSFYALAFKVGTGDRIGKPFDREALLKGNYIDLGTFVHHGDLVEKFGGFDNRLRRLVDWDLIIKLTQENKPVFLPNFCVMDYEDRNDDTRISCMESYIKSKIQVVNKYSTLPTISSVIVCYNQKGFINEALESAISQKGEFVHEVVVSDDGSIDGTREVIRKYAGRYPNLVRDISPDENLGISENYRRCFREAQGQYIAILEGDDYWSDASKNRRQLEFLQANEDVVFVFCRIDVKDAVTSKKRRLKRQEGIGTFLSGKEFAADKNLNLIANFSSVMARKSFLLELPDVVFEPRFNEISFSFYGDRRGRIGFIDKPLTVYRQNAGSVWTGSKRETQLKESIEIRKVAARIARSEFKDNILKSLREKERELGTLD